MRYPVIRSILFLLLIISMSCIAVADTSETDVEDDNYPRESDTRGGQLSLQQQIVNEMNIARTRPTTYAAKVRKYLRYISGGLLRIPGQIAIRTREGASAYREAIRYLQRVQPVSSLTLSLPMSRAAQDHCRDQGRTGRTGHYGSDGSSPFQRMRRYGRYLRSAGENISYGPASAERIVVQLIVDDGVPSRGHRKNIFNPAFRVAGVGVGSHPRFRKMCVINYAGGFVGR